MNITQLQKLINKAIDTEPPEILLEYCETHYSPYYHLMYLLAKKLKGKGLAVELGVETGRASTALALGGMNVLGIDHTRHERVGNVIGAYPNFLFAEADSMPIPDIVKGKNIALLHIDTEHSYSQAKEEFNAYKPYLMDEAIVLFDDLHAMEDEVLRFFEELPYEKIQDDRLHDPCGYGVMIYAKD